MSQKTSDPRDGTAAPEAEAGVPRTTTARRWWILAVISLAELMVVLDGTVVNIALPNAQTDLGFSDGNRQWIVTAYSLAFGSLLLLGGRVSDFFGRKRAFLIGSLGFAVASALGGTAGSFGMLVAARALQGAFGALLAPAALSLVSTTFTDVKERIRAFGLYGAIAGSGGAVGLLLGGVLTEYINWRWNLYINLVFGLIAFIGAAILLERGRRAADARVDYPGAVLVSAGLFSVVYGFSNAESHGWGSPMTWGFLAASTMLLAAFGWWQSRADHPLLPLRVLRDRNRVASFVSVLIANAGVFAVFLFLTYYLEKSLDYSAVKTGLAFLPMVATLMASARLATTVLLVRVGPKPVVPVGFALAGAGLAWLTRLELDSAYASDVLPPLMVVGLGLGLIMPIAMSLAGVGVDPRDAGVASATANASQQIGGSVGTALLNTQAASAVTSYMKGKNPADPLIRANAALESYSTVYWWAAAFFAVGLVSALVVYRRGVPQQDPDAPPVMHT
ncbi:MFS transporter [Streptomyces sp. NPDC002004]